MRCKHCNARLAAHDIWCVECGRQSDVVKNELSSMQSLKKSYKAFMPKKADAIPGTAYVLIGGMIPLLLVIWLFNSYISLKSDTAILMLVNLFVKSIALSTFIAVVLTSFNGICNQSGYSLSLANMRSALRSYPRYKVFTLISALYFSLIYLICFGLPDFAALPILRLVWIVLVNYWVAIVVPAVILMEDLKLSPWHAIKKSYKHFHDVRWNIYLLILVLSAINLLALFFFFVPLIITLPLSFFALRDYVRRLVDFELLEYRR
ncbi:MAG: hypothetical protein PHY48_13830 [Candidatus Cloacimonetes bacterium]|nr:hypothetical protein [Candidatus Cloacimonadota bacterium]